MGKKIIVLGGLWKRAFAFLIDLLLSAVVFCAIYFPLVLPAVSDTETYSQNSQRMAEIAYESGLYVRFGEDILNPTSLCERDEVSDFTTVTVYHNGQAKEFHLLNALYDYWTLKASDFGNKNVTPEVFSSDVLRVGKELSNIESFFLNDDGLYEVALIDEGKSSTTISFLNNAYGNAVLTLNNDPELLALDRENSKISQVAALWAIPVIVGASAIFMLIIPLCLSDGQSLGKKAMGLVVLTDLGYVYPRWKLVPRYLTCLIIEIAGGVASFGATLLISYTMSMFTKKHRSIHDYLCGSVVADAKSSLWFATPSEEEDFEIPEDLAPIEPLGKEDEGPAEDDSQNDGDFADR